MAIWDLFLIEKYWAETDEKRPSFFGVKMRMFHIFVIIILSLYFLGFHSTRSSYRPWTLCAITSWYLTSLTRCVRSCWSVPSGRARPRSPRTSWINSTPRSTAYSQSTCPHRWGLGNTKILPSILYPTKWVPHTLQICTLHGYTPGC